jgi:hypothetical protein
MASSDYSIPQSINITLPSPRRTRSRPKPPDAKLSVDVPAHTQAASEINQSDSSGSVADSDRIKGLPLKIPRKDTGLGFADHTLLLQKEQWLRKHRITIPGNRSNANKLVSATEATLVFAQEEAGTAVCISSQGFLLTCSHCIAETAEELDNSKSHWLLFASGRVVETKCVAWDPKRDLALLQIVSTQPESFSSDPAQPQITTRVGHFPSMAIAVSPPRMDTALACVGHPGSEDLENSVPGVRTNYDVLHVSVGNFRGYADGQDLQDNSEIGALQHDCWTYWGHSGAPLTQLTDGRLVGLHSSWDDETGMRRGVALEAIQEFMQQHENILSNQDVSI